MQLSLSPKSNFQPFFFTSPVRMLYKIINRKSCILVQWIILQFGGSKFKSNPNSTQVNRSPYIKHCNSRLEEQGNRTKHSVNQTSHNTFTMQAKREWSEQFTFFKRMARIASLSEVDVVDEEEEVRRLRPAALEAPLSAAVAAEVLEEQERRTSLEGVRRNA